MSDIRTPNCMEDNMTDASYTTVDIEHCNSTTTTLDVQITSRTTFIALNCLKLLYKSIKTFIKNQYQKFKTFVIDPASSLLLTSTFGRIISTLIQLWVIGDVLSDLHFIWKLIDLGKLWWVFFSVLILYLSLRFNLVFTMAYKKDYFHLKDSKNIFGAALYNVYVNVQSIYDWESFPIDGALRRFVLLYVPSACAALKLVAILQEKYKELVHESFQSSCYILVKCMDIHEYNVIYNIFKNLAILDREYSNIFQRMESNAYYHSDMSDELGQSNREFAARNDRKLVAKELSKEEEMKLNEHYEVLNKKMSQGILSSVREALICLLIGITGLISILIIEIILLPFSVILVSPLVLIGHVVKGIKGIWNRTEVSFYDNPFEIQTIIFYGIAASLFETATESIPQFILQTRVYWHGVDFIPDNSYYIAVFFSFISILKAIIVLICKRKELKNTIYRLVYNITCERKFRALCGYGANITELGMDNLIVDQATLFKRAVRNWPEVDVLHVNNSYITDSEANAIRKYMKKLTHIDLDGSTVSNKGFTWIIESCSQATYLGIGNVKVSDTALSEIASKCIMLRHLSLAHTKITDACLITIVINSGLLEHLNVQHTKITDESTSQIAINCSKLKYLNLTKTNARKVSLPSIVSSCTEIEELHLGYLGIADDSFELSNIKCGQLRHLDLEESNIKDCILEDIIRRSPNLQRLIVRDTNIQDGSAIAINESCSQLQKLYLGRTNLSEKGLRAISQMSAGLTFLNVRYIGDINLIFKTSGTVNWPKLTKLDLEGSDISNIDVGVIIINLPQLIHLNLCYTNITNPGVNSIAYSDLKLQHLNLCDTNVSNVSILLVRCTELKCLILPEMNFNNQYSLKQENSGIEFHFWTVHGIRDINHAIYSTGHMGRHTIH